MPHYVSLDERPFSFLESAAHFVTHNPQEAFLIFAVITLPLLAVAAYAAWQLLSDPQLGHPSSKSQSSTMKQPEMVSVFLFPRSVYLPHLM